MLTETKRKQPRRNKSLLLSLPFALLTLPADRGQQRVSKTDLGLSELQHQYHKADPKRRHLNLRKKNLITLYPVPLATQLSYVFFFFNTYFNFHKTTRSFMFSCNKMQLSCIQVKISLHSAEIKRYKIPTVIVSESGRLSHYLSLIYANLPSNSIAVTSAYFVP